MNILKLNINEYCQLLEKELPVSSENLQIRVALKRIEELGEVLNNVELLEAKIKVQWINKQIPEDLREKVSRLFLKNTEKGSPSIYESLIDEFLQLKPEEQDSLLESEYKELINLICQVDHTKIKNLKNGDTLFHQLLRSDSEKVRQLALVCLKAGADINKQNKNGATGLHLAVLKDDAFIVRELINKGADLSLEAKKLTPLALAIKKGITSAIEFALHNPCENIENLNPIEFFITKMSRGKKSSMSEKISLLIREFFKDKENHIHMNRMWEVIKKEYSNLLLLDEEESDLDIIVHSLLDCDLSSECVSYHTLQVVNLLLEQLIHRKLEGNNDKKIIMKLLERGLLAPSYFILGGVTCSSIVELHKKITSKEITVSQEIEAKIHEITKDENLNTYISFLNIVREVSLDWVGNDIKSYIKLEELTEKIFESNFISKKLIKEIRSEHISQEMEHEIKDHIKNLEFLKLQLKEDKEIDLNKFISLGEVELINVFTQFDRWDLIIELKLLDDSERKRAENKIIFGFFMDKLRFHAEDKYRGFQQDLVAGALIRSLQNIKGFKSTHNDDISRNISIVCEAVIPLLQEFILFYQLLDKPEKCASKIVKRLKSLKNKERLLVPAGCFKHATCILIERESDQSFRMTHYNTGLGVGKHHYRSEEVHKFQTFDIIDNISEESMVSLANWQKTIKSINNSEIDIDPLYEALPSTVATGGERRERSPYDEDYESIQASGTCPYQSLMAFLRHQTMGLMSRDSIENKAFYNIFKANLLNQIYNDNSKQVEDVLSDNLGTVLKKLSAQFELIEIAESEKKFKESLEVINEQLREYGEQGIIASEEMTNVLFRYSKLKQASTKLARTWLKHKEPTFVAESKALQYALAQFIHLSNITQNIKQKLEIDSKKKDIEILIKGLLRVIFVTPFLELGIQEAIERISNDKVPYEGVEMFFKQLKRLEEKHTDIVKRLKDRFLEKRSSDVLRAIHSVW